MKKYIVTQHCRCCYTPVGNSNSNGGMTPFEFSNDINVGEYDEKDFLELVGKEFIESGYFKQFVDCGWIKVVKYEDITKKTVEKMTKKKVEETLDSLETL